jgi:hypothetical protein
VISIRVFDDLFYAATGSRICPLFRGASLLAPKKYEYSPLFKMSRKNNDIN